MSNDEATLPEVLNSWNGFGVEALDVLANYSVPAELLLVGDDEVPLPPRAYPCVVVAEMNIAFWRSDDFSFWLDTVLECGSGASQKHFIPLGLCMLLFGRHHCEESGRIPDERRVTVTLGAVELEMFVMPEVDFGHAPHGRGAFIPEALFDDFLKELGADRDFRRLFEKASARPKD